MREASWRRTAGWSVDCSPSEEESVGNRVRVARLFAQLVLNELVAGELAETPWRGPSGPSTVRMQSLESDSSPTT